MNIKYYIAFKKTNKGTYYGVSEFVENLNANNYAGLVKSFDEEAYKEVSNHILETLELSETLNQSKMISFKYENIDIARFMGNFFDTDKDCLSYKERRHASILSSPAVFLSDLSNMNKAKSLATSHMLLTGGLLSKEKDL